MQRPSSHHCPGRNTHNGSSSSSLEREALGSARRRPLDTVDHLHAHLCGRVFGRGTGRVGGRVVFQGPDLSGNLAVPIKDIQNASLSVGDVEAATAAFPAVQGEHLVAVDRRGSKQRIWRVLDAELVGGSKLAANSQQDHQQEERPVVVCCCASRWCIEIGRHDW